MREFYAIVGRGAGKSRMVLIACAFATREYRLAPGEKVFVGIFAPDRKQAGIDFRYIVGLMRSVPELADLIVRETRDSLELSNRVVVEVLSATIAAPRGRSYALVIVEEAAFLPSDASANPDVELLRAVRPALARAGVITRGGQFAVCAPRHLVGRLAAVSRAAGRRRGARAGRDDGFESDV